MSVVISRPLLEKSQYRQSPESHTFFRPLKISNSLVRNMFTDWYLNHSDNTGLIHYSVILYLFEIDSLFG